MRILKRAAALTTTAMAIAVLTTPMQALANSAPYNYSKYQSVLDDSKLQAPDSDTVAIDYGEFEGEYNDYFYIPSSGNKWMTFQIGPSEKMRSELRQYTEWYTNDSSKLHKMIGEVLISEKGSADEITVMQIHDVTDNSNAINKPLVRIIWKSSQKDALSGNTYTNAYFAVVKTGTCSTGTCSDYVKYYLADYSSSDAIKFEVKVQDSELTIKTEGVAHSVLNGFDISNWDGLESYFKAGAYIQSDTDPDVEVQFESLKYYEQSY
jgi:hypothetical protein